MAGRAQSNGMDDLLLALGTLSVPCVLFAAIAPSFTLDTAGWAVVGVCCGWAAYCGVAYLLLERTDWNVDEIDANVNFAALHALLLAAYIVDNFVSLDLAQQIVMGVISWLIGALVVGQQWKLLRVGPNMPVNEAIFASTLGVFVGIFVLGCLSGTDALAVGIVGVVLVYAALVYASFGVFDSRVQMFCAFWISLFAFQQAVQYCPHNAMLWIPIVVVTVALFLRWTQAVVYRVVSFCGFGRDRESSARMQLLRITLFYTVVLCANLVGFALFITGDRANIVVDVVFFLLFLVLIVFQYAFIYYARDALLIGGFYLMVCLTPLTQIGDAPGWMPVLVYGLGLVVALLVWAQPLMKDTIVRSWFYSFSFSLLTTLIGLAYWGALFATKKGPASAIDYVQCIVGVVAYAFLLVLGAVRSYPAIGLWAWLVFGFFVASAALQIAFSIRNLSASVVVLVVYGMVLVSLVAGLYIYREYELHNENVKASKVNADGDLIDADDADTADDGYVDVDADAANRAR